jgi:hypothetical protein
MKGRELVDIPVSFVISQEQGCPKAKLFCRSMSTASSNRKQIMRGFQSVRGTLRRTRRISMMARGSSMLPPLRSRSAFRSMAGS